MKTIKQLKSLLLILAATLPLGVWATGINIPTAANNYISWNDATVSNATVENSGANIGSTGASTVATFTIGNSTKQDYVLTFKTGSKNEAKMLVTLTNTATEDVVLSKTVDIVNTGNWTPVTAHNFFISQLPEGTYELKFAVTEAASFAGNWGKLAFRAASDYDAIPGTLDLSKGSYNNNGMRIGDSGDEVGWIKNGSYATYSFINNNVGVYQMAMEIKRSNAGSMNIKIVDGNSEETEVDYDYEIPSSSYGTPQNILLPSKLTTGVKTMTLTFTSESTGYICNYKAPTFSRQYNDIAAVSAVDINEQTVTAGDNSDWYCALPVSYGETTTFSVTKANGTVAVTAQDENAAAVSVTDNGNGTYTIATPAMNKTTTISLALTPNGGYYAPKANYTFKIFRIGELSLKEVTVDGVALDVLTDINNSGTSYTATYDGCYTTAPMVAATQIDDAAATIGDPTISGSTYTYTIHGAIEGTELARDYTLILNNVHVYTATGNEENVNIKNNEGTRENGVWSNGVYTLASTSLDGFNQYFKYNGDSYTLSVPADVVVKQIIMKECSNNYAGNDARLTTVTSTGATAYVPVDNKYYHESEGAKHDIIVNIDGHTAGTEIVLTQQKNGQPMGWIQLTTVKQDPGTAPAKTAENVTVVNNHAVVAVTFDREIANDVEATINNTTVTAEGGSATLLFPVWGLNYSTNYTLTIAAGAVKDVYNNTNASAIEIAVNTAAKAAVEKAAYDYVVSTADELKEAIAAIDATNTSASAGRKIIFLKNGTYNLGGNGSANTVQWVNAHNISFIGESKEGVIICGNSADISNPVLNIRYGSGQYMQDLTVRNLKDFDQSKRNGVSVAVYGGNKAIFKNVAMQAQQDTQVTGERSYAVDCDFYGAVDFLCGGGDHYYDHCNFYITNSGYITAPSTSAANKWGYVMQNCTIDNYVGSYTYEADGNFTLGRPWQGEPRNYWLNTTMKAKPSVGGWSGMGSLTTHFYEYNSMDANGNAIDLSSRVNPSSSTNHYTPVLTAEEAAKFTVENVLGGTDSWLPTDYTTVLAAPTVSLDGTTLSWTAVDDARCYVVFKDGAYLTNVTTASYTVSEEGSYTVRAANEMGGLGKVSNAKDYGNVTHTVTDVAADAQGNQVVADKTTGITAGETVTLTITTASDYQLTTIMADQSVTLNAVKNEPNKRTFIMPAANVTINATWDLTENIDETKEITESVAVDEANNEAEITSIEVGKNTTTIEISGTVGTNDTPVTSIAAGTFTAKNTANVQSIDLSQTQVDLDMARDDASSPVKDVPANTLIYLPAGSSMTGDNVIIYDGSGTEASDYNCTNFVMDGSNDTGKSYSVPKPFTATSTTLNREFTENVASTVCLPYALTQVQANALGKFYYFSSVTGNTVSMTQVASGGLESNKPYMFLPNATVGSNNSITATNVEVSIANSQTSSETGSSAFTFQGVIADKTFTSNEIAGGIYGFAAEADHGASSVGQFVKCSNGAYVKSFRAYLICATNLTGEQHPAGARGLGESEALPDVLYVTLINGDGSTTSIGKLELIEIDDNTPRYNLSGQRVGKDYKGIVIINGKKVFIK